MKSAMLFGGAVVAILATCAPADAQRSLRVGVIQIRIADGDRADNISRAIEWIRKGVKESAIQIAVLPETVDIGWITPRGKELAEPIPGPTSHRLAELAKELQIYIVAGLTERDDSVVHDSAILVGPSGQILAKHRKINILKWPKPQNSGNVYYTPGRADDLRVTDTPYGRVGIHICADIFPTNPDLTRKLKEHGARIVISPGGWVANGGSTIESNGAAWRKRISARAAANGVYFIGANCVNTVVAGPDWHGLPYVGQSVIAAPDGRLLKIGAKDKEEIIVADLAY